MSETNGKLELPFTVEWQYMGVGNGDEAIITDGEEDSKALGRALRALINKFGNVSVHTLGLAKCTLWCDCGQYFEVEHFACKGPLRGERKVNTFRFSAHCLSEGLQHFMWMPCARIEECNGRGHRVTSLVLVRPEPKREPWKPVPVQQ